MKVYNVPSLCQASNVSCTSACNDSKMIKNTDWDGQILGNDYLKQYAYPPASFPRLPWKGCGRWAVTRPIWYPLLENAGTCQRFWCGAWLSALPLELLQIFSGKNFRDPNWILTFLHNSTETKLRPPHWCSYKQQQEHWLKSPAKLWKGPACIWWQNAMAGCTNKCKMWQWDLVIWTLQPL